MQLGIVNNKYLSDAGVSCIDQSIKGIAVNNRDDYTINYEKQGNLCRRQHDRG